MHILTWKKKKNHGNNPDPDGPKLECPVVDDVSWNSDLKKIFLGIVPHIGESGNINFFLIMRLHFLFQLFLFPFIVLR